jgi:hypothetical protein
MVSPPISHSQFVDDTLMMGSPTVKEAHSFLSILQTFSEASGLDFNKDKSQIFFFNTSCSNPEQYLYHPWVHQKLPSIQIPWHSPARQCPQKHLLGASPLLLCQKAFFLDLQSPKLSQPPHSSQSCASSPSNLHLFGACHP